MQVFFPIDGVSTSSQTLHQNQNNEKHNEQLRKKIKYFRRSYFDKHIKLHFITKTKSI
jgi:Trm5-related predicted tRNA methylase